MSDHHEHEHHITPLWILNGVFAILLVCTVLTVAAIKIDLGWVNIYLAIGIALVKAFFVAVYFMHLKWDRAFHTLCLIGSFLFITIFMGYVLVDSAQYSGTIEAYEDANLNQVSE